MLPPEFPFLGIVLSRLTRPQFIERIRAAVHDTSCATFTYAHFHTMNVIHERPDALAAFRAMDVVTPDGVAMLWSTQLLGNPLTRENIIVMEYSMALLAPVAIREGWSLFLFGGDRSIAERAAARLRSMYPGLSVAGTLDGQVHTEEERHAAALTIAASRPTIVLVGLGQPTQEAWISRYRDVLGARAIIGVGGYLEKLARRETIYPAWVNRTHLYWLYRLLTEPGRVWSRYSVGALKYSWRLGLAMAKGQR